MMSPLQRDVLEIRRKHAAQVRALAEVLRQFAARDEWLRSRLIELHLRVKALDGITPEGVPAWPAITIPPELAGILQGE